MKIAGGDSFCFLSLKYSMMCHCTPYTGGIGVVVVATGIQLA